MTWTLAYGCLYVAGHQLWAWTFRAMVDPWERRLIGKRLGVRVIWARAMTFPIELWTWGTRRVDCAGVDAKLAGFAAAWCLAGAIVPTVILGLVLSRAACPARLADAMYLVTAPMMFAFVAVQMKRS
jgi:hypothetical protein